ncbi:MAG: heme-binding domain-containing protein [Flavisolibacter sp.]|nr:heme-binding domain-containing protein [Flavisolibacter sp.]
MRILKGIGLFLLLAFVVIQFFRPDRNINKGDLPGAIAKQVPVPAEVQSLLKNACYDCHSNNTRYPWYVNMQPGAWFMSQHIRDGKKELNFDEFGTYSGRRQLSKLKSIAGSVKDGSMPLSFYALIHKEARLSDKEKELIIEWALQTKDSLETSK